MPTFSLARKHAELDAHNARVLARITQENPVDRRPVAGATAGGDERRLRGIPAIARGVRGAIPGTTP